MLDMTAGEINELIAVSSERISAECARRRKTNRQCAKRSRLRRLSGDTMHDEQVRAARLSGKIEALQAANQVLRHKHMMQTGWMPHRSFDVV
jgi:hypothetical protein